MINEIDKDVMYLIASQVMLKCRNLWYYDNYRSGVEEAIACERVFSYYSVNGSYRRCGKSTMLVKMNEEIENSIILVGNEANRRYINSCLKKHGTRKNYNIIILPNKKYISETDLHVLRGINNECVVLVDDSVSEETIYAIRKHMPKTNLFGFTFKKAVSLI